MCQLDQKYRFLRHEITDENNSLIIINACSRNFVFQGNIPKECVFWDLNYIYEPHFYIKEIVKEYIDGLELLKLQAKHALDFWNLPD